MNYNFRVETNASPSYRTPAAQTGKVVSGNPFAALIARMASVPGDVSPSKDGGVTTDALLMQMMAGQQMSPEMIDMLRQIGFVPAGSADSLTQIQGMPIAGQNAIDTAQTLDLLEAPAAQNPGTAMTLSGIAGAAARRAADVQALMAKLNAVVVPNEVPDETSAPMLADMSIQAAALSARNRMQAADPLQDESAVTHRTPQQLKAIIDSQLQALRGEQSVIKDSGEVTGVSDKAMHANSGAEILPESEESDEHPEGTFALMHASGMGKAVLGTEANEISRRIDNFEQIADEIGNAVGQGIKQFTMKLSPEGLGEIEIKLEFINGMLNVKLLSDSKAVSMALSSRLGELQNSLQGASITVDSAANAQNNANHQHQFAQPNYGHDSNAGSHHGYKENNGGKNEAYDFSGMEGDIEQPAVTTIALGDRSHLIAYRS